jgi:hypothetical protein
MMQILNEITLRPPTYLQLYACFPAVKPEHIKRLVIEGIAAQVLKERRDRHGNWRIDWKKAPVQKSFE